MGSLQSLPYDKGILRPYSENEPQTESESFESSSPETHAHVCLRSAAFFLRRLYPHFLQDRGGLIPR